MNMTIRKYAVGAGAFATLFAGMAFAEESGQSAALAASAVSCIQNAIDSRDNAVIAGIDAQSASVKSAIQTRTASLKAAWAQADKKARRDALKAAWDANRKAIKASRESFKTARKAAWDKFNADRSTLPYISFIVIFIVVVILVRLLGSFVKNSVDKTFLGSVDQALGAGLGGFRTLFMLSVVLWILDSLKMTPYSGWAEGSWLYPFTALLAPKLADWFGQFIPFFSEIFKQF